QSGEQRGADDWQPGWRYGRTDHLRARQPRFGAAVRGWTTAADGTADAARLVRQLGEQPGADGWRRSWRYARTDHLRAWQPRLTAAVRGGTTAADGTAR